MFRKLFLATSLVALSTACTQQTVTDAQLVRSESSGAVGAVAAVTPGQGASLLAEDGSETLGFAFDYFWFAVNETPQDCPEGFAMALRDVAIMNLPKDRQSYLLQPENRSDYYKMGYRLSAVRMAEQGGKSICNIPDSYDDPIHKVVQSPVSYGRDLDGVNSDGADTESCGGVDFTSPDGRTGVDNQLYRVMGCIDSFRRDAEFAGGAMEDYHIGSYRDGETTTLMEITGVDDRLNDDEVTIGIYSSHEPTPFDAEKNGVPYGSLTVTDNLLWHNEVKGRIVDGELISDTFDLRLKFGWSGRPAEYVIKGSRIHLTLNEDGSASGDLAGYFDTKHAYWHNFHNDRGALEVANGFTCPAVHDALMKYSDGYPDPETGQCTAISTAMSIKAVPTFVLHQPKEQLQNYFLDTREYYGVELAEIAVEGATPRPLNEKIGPQRLSQDDKEYKDDN